MFRRSLANRYNAAAWHETVSGNTILLVREVTQAAPKGEPDRGAILRLELDPSGQVLNETVVWQPDQEDRQHLEDTRALLLPDGRVQLGLTAVIRQGEVFVPYPALTTLEATNWRAELPPVVVFQNLGPGKNTTPLSEQEFLFRRDDQACSHELAVCRVDGSQAELLSTIQFPTDLPWARWRIGTTLPPLWQTTTEALLIIHGITITDNRYIYSLGKAKLSRKGDLYQVEIWPEPLLTPDSFRGSDEDPLQTELHQERRVVYACGGVQKEVDNSLVLALFVNVGDRRTVEVHLPMAELKAPWWPERQAEVGIKGLAPAG